MPFFRFVAIALPQILILLWVGGTLDLLGGWNQTGDALGTLLALFLLNPVVALVLLTVEIKRCCKACKGERGWPLFFIGLAIILFVESLAIDLYFLTQVRM